MEVTSLEEENFTKPTAAIFWKTQALQLKESTVKHNVLCKNKEQKGLEEAKVTGQVQRM